MDKMREALIDAAMQPSLDDIVKAAIVHGVEDAPNKKNEMRHRRIVSMVRALFAERYQAAQSAAVPEHIRAIKIPTDAMEQEFQKHYRRGYEAGKSDAVPVVGDGMKASFDKWKAERIGRSAMIDPLEWWCGGYAAATPELATLREKAAQLEHELETERMRLAACGVIALSNTADSAINSRDMLPEYWSASAQDCASAVDREMDYRSRLAVTEQERDELRKDAERWIKANEGGQFCIAQWGVALNEWVDLLPSTAIERIDAAIAQGKGE